MTTRSDLSRRALLASGGALAASGLVSPAWAQELVPAPAYHRPTFAAGDLLVLSDGHLVVPTSMLAGNVPDADLRAFLAGRGLGRERVLFHINVVLLRRGDEYVLIDAGAGGTWQPTAGRLADSLEAAGITPDQIGKVVLTHAHPDHIWGLIDDLDNSLRFPRAQYLISAREFAFWTSGESARLSGPLEGIAAGARRVLTAIRDLTTLIKPGTEILPGIAAIDSAGHTPGHISLLVTTGAHKLLVTADAVQNNHVALMHSDWQPVADMDGARGARSRRQLLDLAASEGLTVVAYHLPFPGLGRIERQGTAFVWRADL
jgi:glyoxylase-like metal-dependent hydrolase (beta-lactamase superfamily II)